MQFFLISYNIVYSNISCVILLPHKHTTLRPYSVIVYNIRAITHMSRTTGRAGKRSECYVIQVILTCDRCSVRTSMRLHVHFTV